jgi:hypothetical protein
MKKAFLISIAIIGLLSCEDPEIKDPVAGNWLYENPSIKASFTFTPADRTYTVSNIAITIDGINSTEFTGTAEAVEIGDKIGKLILTKGNQTITLFNCDNLVMHPGWTIDNVEYKNGNTITKFKGGSLKAN